MGFRYRSRFLFLLLLLRRCHCALCTIAVRLKKRASAREKRRRICVRNQKVERTSKNWYYIPDHNQKSEKVLALLRTETTLDLSATPKGSKGVWCYLLILGSALAFALGSALAFALGSALAFALGSAFAFALGWTPPINSFRNSGVTSLTATSGY